MPYDPDWTRAQGWNVDWKSTKNPWSVKVTPTADRLTFHGDGAGPTTTDDIIKKNGGATPVGEECSHSVVLGVEKVRAKHNGAWYIITLKPANPPTEPKATLSCVSESSSSGGTSWTAQEG